MVRSFRERVAAKFRVSVAEIAPLNRASVAVLAVAVVANERGQCDEVLEKVARTASVLRDAVLADRATELVSFGYGGAELRGGVDQWLSSPSSQSLQSLQQEPHGRGDNHEHADGVCADERASHTERAGCSGHAGCTER